MSKTILNRINQYGALWRFHNHYNYLIVILTSLSITQTSDVVQELIHQYIFFNILLYGGIYILNGIIDCDQDKLHPEKSKRPLPSGALSKQTAFILILILWGICLIGVDSIYYPLYSAFILINVFYSLYIKKTSFRSLIGITAGLRVSLGFLIAGQSLWYAPSLMVLATLFMMSIQQTKFFAEKTKGYRYTILINCLLTLMMLPLLYWNFFVFPGITVCILCAIPLFIYIPLFYPSVAQRLLGADIKNDIVPPLHEPILAFDFDGTICDSILAIKDAVNHFSSVYHFKPISDDSFHILKGMSIKQIQKELGIGTCQLMALGRNTRKILGQKMDELNPVQGIVPVLHELKNCGFRLIIISSNNQQNIRRFLEFNNIDVFSEIYTYEGIGSGLWSKKKKLKCILKKYGHCTNGIVYICDEVRDVNVAQGMRLPVIAVTWGANNSVALQKANPTFLVDTPQDLVSRIKFLFK